MQSYSYQTIHNLSSDKILAINLLFTERFENARERLLENDVRFFREVRPNGYVYLYEEEDLPVPTDYGMFEEIPFSDYESALKAVLHRECAEELFSEWEAQELKESSHLVDPFKGKIALTDDDLPF